MVESIQNFIIFIKFIFRAKYWILESFLTKLFLDKQQTPFQLKTKIHIIALNIWFKKKNIQKNNQMPMNKLTSLIIRRSTLVPGSTLNFKSKKILNYVSKMLSWIIVDKFK